MKQKFKVGDSVWVRGTIPGTNTTFAEPREGKILDGTTNNWRVQVLSCKEFPKGDFWWLHNDNLLPADTFMTYANREPQVGDTIKIVSYQPHPEWNGTVGTIEYLSKHYWQIKSASRGHLSFSKDGSTIEIISSQSPPQINQTDLDLLNELGVPVTNAKENEMKPYTVLYQNFSTHGPASTLGNFTTEAEAREYAETYVYSLRSNLQNKQWFTVTIVNTKTGQLVGSVVDAPPAVDWVK